MIRIYVMYQAQSRSGLCSPLEAGVKRTNGSYYWLEVQRHYKMGIPESELCSSGVTQG